MKSGVSGFGTADTAARARHISDGRASSSSRRSKHSHSCAPPSPSGVRARARGAPTRGSPSPGTPIAVADRVAMSTPASLASARVLARASPRAGSTRSSSPASGRRGDGSRGRRRTPRRTARSRARTGARGVDDARRPTRAERGAPRRRPARTRRVPGRVAPAGGHRRRVSALGNRRRGVSSSALLLRHRPRLVRERARPARGRVRGSASAAAALEAFLTSTRAALPDELLDAVRESLVESASAARDVGWLSREAAVMDGTAGSSACWRRSKATQRDGPLRGPLRASSPARRARGVARPRLVREVLPALPRGRPRAPRGPRRDGSRLNRRRRRGHRPRQRRRAPRRNLAIRERTRRE